MLVADLGRLAATMPEAKPLADALYALAYLYPRDASRREALRPLVIRLCAFADDVVPGMPGFDSIRAAAQTLKNRVMFRPQLAGTELQQKILELRQTWARERALDGYSKSAGESPRPRPSGKSRWSGDDPPKSHWSGEDPPTRPRRDEARHDKPRMGVVLSIPWQDYFKQLPRRVPSEWIAPPALTDSDELLVTEWSRGDHVVRAYDHARLYSARVAEKGLETFYESMGFSVTDVSGEQLSTVATSDWRLGDLRVGDRLIDVKNSRASFAKRSEKVPSYVEHCVPRFKKERWGKPVTIAGVLSPYIPDGAKRDTWKQEIQFLGETSQEALDKIRNYFCRDDLLEIDFHRPDGSGVFLPPWTFEYPGAFYSRTQSGQPGGVDRPDEQWPSFNDLSSARLQPLAILAMFQESWPDHWPRSESDELTLDFLERLGSASMALGRSRPVIWVAILRFVLELMGDMNRTGGWSPEKLLPVIFFREGAIDRPLGLYDPLRTVHSLLTVLDTAWKYLESRPLAFRQFQVVSGAILRARTDARAPWTTIVAYCGGWKTYAGARYPDGQQARCGNTPLYLGMHQTCPGCSRLICDACGFCMSGCRHLEEHQLEADEKNRPVLDSESWDSEMRDGIEAVEDDCDDDIPF